MKIPTGAHIGAHRRPYRRLHTCPQDAHIEAYMDALSYPIEARVDGPKCPYRNLCRCPLRCPPRSPYRSLYGCPQMPHRCPHRCPYRPCVDAPRCPYRTLYGCPQIPPTDTPQMPPAAPTCRWVLGAPRRGGTARTPPGSPGHSSSRAQMAEGFWGDTVRAPPDGGGMGWRGVWGGPNAWVCSPVGGHLAPRGAPPVAQGPQHPKVSPGGTVSPIFPAP